MSIIEATTSNSSIADQISTVGTNTTEDSVSFASILSELTSDTDSDSDSILTSSSSSTKSTS